jgi:inosine/xanthosine triphosphatase
LIQIAVGSSNPAKIEAVRLTVDRIWPEATLLPVAVSSGVAAMPLSDAECLAGARNRARTARAETGADLGIGLEGGVNPEPAGLMLLGWVSAIDGNGQEGIGGTVRLPLPAAIAVRVEAGAELGLVMDELLGTQKSNQRGGAVGALTAGLVPRAQAFAMAVAYALSPFVAPGFYSSGLPPS